jgi:drug/metabolite transporter (DMT)-like permease
MLTGAALGIVYAVWGSTYLAIRIMVGEMPPLVGAGARFLTAGLLVAGILVARGGRRRMVVVTGRELAGCALIGVLLPVLGQGSVTVGEKGGAPSGITVVAFSAYVWLLQSAAVSLAATYAYVNPLVAVLLGWLILAEPVTMPTIVGGAVVVVAVAIVVSSERPAGRPPLQKHANPGPEPAVSITRPMESS